MNFHIGNFQTEKPEEKPSSDKAADLGHSSLLNKSISC
jgi:hypothetical protein